ncbi:unnamed protein product [Lampetra fluviatilis]
MGPGGGGGGGRVARKRRRVDGRRRRRRGAGSPAVLQHDGEGRPQAGFTVRRGREQEPTGGRGGLPFASTETVPGAELLWREAPWGKSAKIIKDLSHPSHGLFTLLSSGRRHSDGKHPLYARREREERENNDRASRCFESTLNKLRQVKLQIVGRRDGV